MNEPNKESSNFLQVGQTIACGHCHPEKFSTTSNFRCECICHTPEPQGWEKEFDKDYDISNVDEWTLGIVAMTLTHEKLHPLGNASHITEKLKKLIDSLLSLQRSEDAKKWEEKLALAREEERKKTLDAVLELLPTNIEVKMKDGTIIEIDETSLRSSIEELKK